MARPLRIEFAGAVYHITARGDRRESIVEDDGDRQTWLELLGEACTRMAWRCYAYCLMDNHYHVVVETEGPTLSKGMRLLNGVYTQRFNRRHGRVGHVFQGRYKAVLVDKDNYLMELSRYVVLNPVRAGMVPHPGQWRWSSYAETAGRRTPPPWLVVDRVLGQFDDDTRRARRRYVRFVGDGNGVPPIWSELRQRLYLGDEDFVARMQEQMEPIGDISEIPRTQREAAPPSLATLARRHPTRNDAMCAAYATGRYTLKEIAEHFGVHYSTVSRAVRGGAEMWQCKT